MSAFGPAWLKASTCSPDETAVLIQQIALYICSNSVLNFIIQSESSYRLLKVFTDLKWNSTSAYRAHFLLPTECQRQIQYCLKKWIQNYVNWDIIHGAVLMLTFFFLLAAVDVSTLPNLQHRNCWSKSVIKKSSDGISSIMLWYKAIVPQSWMCLLWSIYSGSELMSIVYPVLYLEVVNA